MMHVTVQKRAETEEHFKRLVLNPRKPLNRLTRPQDVHYLLLEGDDARRKKNIFGKFIVKHELFGKHVWNAVFLGVVYLGKYQNSILGDLYC